MSWQKLVCDPRLYLLLGQYDEDRAAETRAGGCRICGGVLHSAAYRRKPRGGHAELGDTGDRRCSFCCAEEGCRTRHTPPSLRFLGRKVYVSTAVVLVTAMRHGATPARMRTLREHLGVSRRTVERWRVWWREAFAESAFWKAATAAFLPPVARDLLPTSLLERFGGDDEARLLALLRFLSPITGGAGLGQAG